MIEELKNEISALKAKLGDESGLGELNVLRKRVDNLENLLRDKNDSYNELLNKYQELKSDFEEASRLASVSLIIKFF